MDPLIVTSIIGGLNPMLGLKVVHSVLDSLNRRRAPSRDILVTVDGPEEADQVAEVATHLVERIERHEGYTLADMPTDSIRRYADVLLDATKAKARTSLPAADESRARAMLDDMRKNTPELE